MRRAAGSPLVAYVVGYDPGLANAGAAVMRLGARAEFDEPISLEHWTTEASTKKRNVLTTDDNLRRAREMGANMLALHRKLDGVTGQGVRAIAAEAMSFPRNASTSAKIAMFWGGLACACEVSSYPMVQASPQEIRRALGLPTKAKKPEVHAKLFARFPTLKAQLARVRARGPVMTDKQWAEAQLHPLDALAAIVAVGTSEVIRLIRASLA